MSYIDTNIKIEKMSQEISRENWLLVLGVMSEYMPKLKIVKEVLDKMLTKGLNVPTPNQQTTIIRLYEESYNKKQIDAELTRLQEQQEIKDYSRAMKDKHVKSSPKQLHVNPHPFEIYKYKDNERVAIGFKSSIISTPSVNRYSLDNGMKYKTKKETFDFDARWGND
jgi:hypothetical protein